MAKQFRIEPVPSSTLVQIAYTGGGEVPDELKGAYTSRVLAELAIKAWKAAHPERDVEVVPEKSQEKRKKESNVPMEPLG